MIKGFKEFILRGNVIDLAVAVVIGAAFGAVVTAVVDTIITPLIGIFYVPNDSGQSGPTITGIYGQEVVFPLPSLLTAIISFFAIAIVVYFALVYPMNRLKQRQAARAGVVETATPGPTQEELLVQIRDLLEKQTGSSVSTTPPAP